MTAVGRSPAGCPVDVPLVHAPRLAWRAVAGEVVVVDLRSNLMVALNGAGGVLWEACQRPRGVAELAKAAGLPLVEVEGFLATLWDCGLVVAAPGPAELLPAIPVPQGELPRVLWTEQLQSFVAASCAQLPGQSDICNQVPSG